FFGAAAVFFDLQKLIECAFSLGRAFQKYRRKSSLRYADRPPKKRFEIRARLNAQMLAKKTHNVFFLVGDAHLQRRIVNEITGSGVAHDLIFAFVLAADKAHAGNAFFRTAADEILFLVIEKIEQNPRDRLDYRSFSGSVLA